MLLLATKLKNQLIAVANETEMTIDVKLKNISINGHKTGCSGHVWTGDSCVYLTTEESVFAPLAGKTMYRLAENPADYGSNRLVNGNNRWCKPEELATKVIETLANEKPIKR